MTKIQKWIIAGITLIPVVIIPVLFFMIGMNATVFLVLMLITTLLAGLSIVFLHKGNRLLFLCRKDGK